MKKCIVLVFLLLSKTLIFGQPFANDLGVTAIVSPTSFMMPSAAVIVAIHIQNFGTQPQSNFPVEYFLNGSAPVIEVCAVTLNPGASINFTFSTTVDINSQACNELTIMVLPDQNPINDAKTITIWITNLGFTTTTFYPANQPLWTGTTDSLFYLQNSLVQFAGDGSKIGWMMFDISGIPPASTILSAQLELHALAPFTSASFMLRSNMLSPVNNTSAMIYYTINTGSNYLSYNNNVFAGQTLNFNLPQSVIHDLTNSIGLGYYSMGITENTADTANIGTFAGWNQWPATRPSITITYCTLPIGDVGIVSVDIDTSSYVYGQVIPQVTVANYGILTANFSVTATADGGYSSTKTMTGLEPAQYGPIQFDPWTADSGPVCFHFELSNTQDENCVNNKADFCWDNTFPPLVFGNVSYKNSANTPLRDSTIVFLIPYNPPGIIQIDTVDQNGNFVFENVSAGDYYLQVLFNKTWGGGNSSDALAVLKHFVGMTQLTGLNLQAADVNADSQVNSIDALMILQRFVWIIVNFPAGDWVAEQPFITVPPVNYLPVSLKVLCAGDVNGSFVP